jgi:hypothetical protein
MKKEQITFEGVSVKTYKIKITEKINLLIKMGI